MNVRICQGPRVDGFSHVTILVFAASQKGEKSKSRNSRDYTFRSFWDLGHAQRLHFCISFTSWMPHCPSPGFFFTKHPSSVTFSRCPSGTAWSRHCRAALCSTWLATRKNMKIHMTGAICAAELPFCWWHSKKVGHLMLEMLTLWSTNITMENHHVQWVNPL